MGKPWWESGVFGAVCAIAGLLLAILAIVMQPGRTLAIAACSVLAAVLLVIVILWYRGRKPPEPQQIPSDALAIKLSVSGATPDELLWIANLEKRYFGEDAIPLAILQDWYAANPNGFQVVGDEQGNPVGHLDVLAVKEEAFAPFIAGKISERELHGNALFTPAERELVRDLYVESVIIEGDKRTHDLAVTQLLNSVDTILALLGNPASLRYVFGLGATRAGIDFMKEKGFDLVTEARDRIDEHPLYRIRYSSLLKRLHQDRGKTVR